jgi:hypothetical protein
MGAARGYTWPPFEPGNEAAVTHGVWRAGRAEQIRERVEALAANVADAFPWTVPYELERAAYARAAVDEADVQAYLDAVGALDEHGSERSAVRTLERFASRAARCRAALGLSPDSHAKILRNVSEVVRRHPERSVGALAGPLEALLAEGRSALERGAGGAEGDS